MSEWFGTKFQNEPLCSGYDLNLLHVMLNAEFSLLAKYALKKFTIPFLLQVDPFCLRRETGIVGKSEKLLFFSFPERMLPPLKSCRKWHHPMLLTHPKDIYQKLPYVNTIIKLRIVCTEDPLCLSLLKWCITTNGRG